MTEDAKVGFPDVSTKPNDKVFHGHVEETDMMDTTSLAQQSLDTVIVFDWDDTLLASSYLSSKGYKLEESMVRCEEVDAALEQLSETVISVLTIALRYGKVVIITNAEHGWVQLSAAKFMPKVVPLLERVSICSARSTYEKAHDSPLKWKFMAFQDQLGRCFQHHNDVEKQTTVKNVISFGDSHVEREAVRAVGKTLERCYAKSVKFAERPSIEQLKRQIELVTNCFQYVFSHQGDLDLMLTISLMY